MLSDEVFVFNPLILAVAKSISLTIVMKSKRVNVKVGKYLKRKKFNIEHNQKLSLRFVCELILCLGVIVESDKAPYNIFKKSSRV